MIKKLLLGLSKKTTDSILISHTKELLAFTIKEVISCIFPLFIFLLLVFSKIFNISLIPRYDFLLIACLLMQCWMYIVKLETLHELLVITMFHFLGICLEMFKVKMGSWSYPEFSYLKIMQVPIYSGFMYASVGSYVCQAWRWFDLKIENWPKAKYTFFISAFIYINFFTHHFFVDLRWLVTLILLIIFRKTYVYFNTNNTTRKMSIVLSFMLIGFFIWIAENLATYLGAWKYASQHNGWKMVDWGKISSWFLLIVLSIVIVAQLKIIKYSNTNDYI